jgi:hypothetical protein
MKKLLFSFVMFLSALALFAQPAIQFENTTYDFGNIKEEGGKVSGKFIFTNTGNQDLLITTVKASCGCTAADYTKTAVAPGEKGFIEATYNPFNRPGGFNKNIRVTTNEPKFESDANASPYVIYIKGNVEKKAPTKYETAGYKTGSGDIRIKENNIRLDMLNTESKSFTIQVMNFSETSSTLEPTNLPKHISFDRIETIKPGQEVEITFKYDAAIRGEIGIFKDIVTIQTQDPTEPRVSLFIDATIKEDFSKLTPKQLQEAPVVGLETTTLDFGKVAKNASPVLEVKLHNNGKKPLNIRQLRASNTVFTVVTDKNEIAKGDFATLTITLNSRNRRGMQNATIEIITNDPANSHLILNCKGDISQ